MCATVVKRMKQHSGRPKDQNTHPEGTQLKKLGIYTANTKVNNRWCRSTKITNI